MITNVSLRDATLGDAEAITEIYAHHVLNGTASFDTVPRSCAETRNRIETCLKNGWPFLVAEVSGAVVAYAYATQFRERPAYASTCENSIYVRRDCLGKGIGKLLLAALERAATRRGFRQMIAVAGGGEAASVGLHKSLGFREAGRMEAVGRKFGTWLDTVYLQLPLGLGADSPPATEP